jgi:hypothetical protein
MTTSTILLLLAIIYFVIVPSFKTRVFYIKKLLMMPAIFLYMSYDTATHNFTIHAYDYVVILIGFVIGAGIGMALRQDITVKADHAQQLIELPGSFFSLFIFIAIFTVHYLIGYVHAVSPSYLLHFGIGQQVLFLLLAAASSLTVGSNGVVYTKYLAVESCALVAPEKKSRKKRDI